MTSKIIIDTNIFLDFYRAHPQSLSKLEELLKYSEHLIFPSQVFYEFKRNRTKQFKDNITRYNDYRKRLNPHNSAFISSLEEYQQVISLKKELEESANMLIKKIESMHQQESNDLVNNVVSELFDSSAVKKINITEELINKANNRKLLGNPPGSKNDITIGDELIWESILSVISENIVIVTNDKSYVDHKSFLSYEIRQTGYELLDITGSISEALDIIGADPSPKLEELEKELIKYHDFGIYNKDDIEGSNKCGCFYCINIFNPDEITAWTDEGDTALCPRCGIDSVLGDASGIEITNHLLEQMHTRWFDA